MQSQLIGCGVTNSHSMAVKQVIIARTDLGLSPGKLAAQVAHASVNASEAARHVTPEWHETWLDGEYTKIVLEGDGETHLRHLAEDADSANLPYALVSDAGYTEVESGTVTALCIGPAETTSIDPLTGDLSLYPSG